ncbi:MAG: nucleolar RNA-binding Nop10p family protein [Candidatus Woesearchaeota archaeon]
MSNHIRKCNKCNTYTMDKTCPNCSNETKRIRIMNFSIEDNHGKYRRKYKYGV